MTVLHDANAINGKTSDLLTASARLAAIVESSADAIISKDLTGIITSWNRGAENIFGYTADEAVGQHITMLMPSEQADEEPGIIARICRGERVDHYETIRRHKDGRLLDISLTVSPIRDQNGTVIGASKIARDITHRKAAEVELAKLAEIVNSSSDAIVSKDLNGVIRSWNRGAERIFGYSAAEAIGQNITMLMPPDRVNEEPGIIARIKRGEAVDHYETIRQRKDGSLIDISLNVSPVYDARGVIVGASKIARDITATKRVEAALRETEIMHRLIDAQESERHRIARDLHDHLGQRMTALRLRIESLLEKLPHDPAMRQEVDEMREFALMIDRDLGFLSWELRPTELDTLGLEDAIRSFIAEWGRHYDISGEFHTKDDIHEAGLPPQPLTPNAETNLYRIVQEALNNIVKHAQAKNVSVVMYRRPSEVVIVIDDDGNGFEHAGAPDISGPDGNGTQPGEDQNRYGGQGLTIMHERAALLGGTLEVESRPGSGTTIIARVPVG